MIAILLSGGGNRGALEAGALLALFERGIRPEMLIGTSAGALNAAFLAVNPCLERAQELAEVWRNVKRQEIFPGNALTALWRMARGKDGLCNDWNRLQFILRHLPAKIRTFGDIRAVQLYITATNLNTGQPYFFGEDPSDSVADALMASTALPPYFAPWPYRGWQYVDGGAVANVPIRWAVAKGARELYVIDLTVAPPLRPSIRGLVGIMDQTVGVMLYHQVQEELVACAQRGIIVHYIAIDAFAGLPIWDFHHSSEMIVEGRKTMEQYLREEAREAQPTRITLRSLVLRWGTEWLRRRRLRRAAAERLDGPSP
ncbi:MAG: patatin-like phospholipase family protein, partial [Anaerolineae bacterium]